MSLRFPLRSLAACVLLFAGCSRNKLGIPTQGAPPPLTIVSVSPADGASDLAPDTPVVVTFSRALDESSAKSALTLAADGAPIDGRASVTGSSLVFAAAALPESGTHLTATLAPGVRGTGGGTAAPGKTWSFSIRTRRAWEVVDALGDGASAGLRMAWDAGGRGFAIWRAGTHVLANEFLAAAGWRGAETLDASGAARDPAIASLRDGGAIAAFVDGGAIVTRTFADGAWSEPATVYPGPDRPGAPTLAVTSSGEAVVAWSIAGGEVWATTPGSTTPVKISDPGTLAFDPRIVTVGNEAAAVWRESDGTMAWIVASSTIGGVWEAPVRLSTVTSTDAYDPALVAIDRGAIAAWSQRTHSTSSPAPSLWSAQLGSGGWSSAQVLADPMVTGTADVSGAGAGGITAPVLSPDGSGGAWILWRERDGQTMSETNVGSLHASHYRGSWGPQSIVDDGTRGAPASFGVAADETGEVIAAWRRGLGDAASLQTAVLAGTIAPPAVSAGIARDVGVASANGRILVVWRGADGKVSAVRFE